MRSYSAPLALEQPATLTVPKDAQVSAGSGTPHLRGAIGMLQTRAAKGLGVASVLAEVRRTLPSRCRKLKQTATPAFMAH